MKLSIIIPVYAVETTLNQCIESVVSQDYNDFELLLVDDGSPDHCPQICDRWAAKDQRVRVIHQKNGGLSDARNKGIEEARGEYITFIDSDDYIEAHTLKPLMSHLSFHPEIDIAYGQALVMAIVGNAMIPQLTAFIMHKLPNIYHIAYLIPLVCFLFCAYYGWKGYKQDRKEDIYE